MLGQFENVSHLFYWVGVVFLNKLELKFFCSRHLPVDDNYPLLSNWYLLNLLSDLINENLFIQIELLNSTWTKCTIKWWIELNVIYTYTPTHKNPERITPIGIPCNIILGYRKKVYIQSRSFPKSLLLVNFKSGACTGAQVTLATALYKINKEIPIAREPINVGWIIALKLWYCCV